MPKTGRKEPKLSAGAREALKSAIRMHPNAAKYLVNGTQLAFMRKAELLALAKKLSIDVPKIVAEEAADHGAAWRAEIRHDLEQENAFSGHIEFDLELRLLGKVVHRRARLEYEHTPEDWNYFDVASGAEKLGRGEWITSLEVLAIPEGDVFIPSASGKITKRKNKPVWTKIDLWEDGVLPREITDEFDKLIDEDCRMKDRLNRDSFNASTRRK